MKKKKLSIYLIFGFLILTFNSTAQKLVKTSEEHTLSSKAGKPGALIDFSVQKEKNEINLKYLVKDNKKKIVYETYTFDLGSLKKKNVETDEIEKEKAKKTFRKYRGDDVTRFVRVKNNMTGQMVFERGYVAANSSASEFITEQKEKYKGKNNRKLSLVALRTDAQQYELNISSFADFSELANRRNYLGTGNALIFSFIKPKAFKAGEITPGTKFKSMIISYEDLSIISQNEFSFKYPHYPYAYTETSDGGLALVLMPMNRGTLNNLLANSEVELQPNLNEFILLTIDAKGKETGRFPFEVKKQHANLKITQTAEGDFLIYGYSNDFKVGSNDKKPNMTMGYLDNINEEYGKSGIRLGAPTSYEIVKITKAGKLVFANSVSLETTLEKAAKSTDKDLKIPNSKKWEKYFKDSPLQSDMFEVNGNYFMQFASAAKSYQLLQFSNKGEFETSYFTPKTGDVLVEQMVVPGPTPTAYWLKTEHKEGKAEMWVTITEIDPTSKKVVSSEIPGNKKYFGNLSSSFASAEGLGEVIIYLQNGKKIYLGKLPFK